MSARALAGSLVLLMAGCLGPSAAVVPGTGGADCGVAPVARWQEAGLFAALAARGTESRPDASLASDLGALVPGVAGLAVEEVYVEPGDGSQGLHVRATPQGPRVTLVMREALDEAARVDVLASYLGELGAADHARGVLADLRQTGVMADGEGRLVVLEGTVDEPLSADAMAARLVATPPAFQTAEAGSGTFTLIWDAEGLRDWVHFEAPVRALDLDVAGAPARLQADAAGGASVALDPAAYGRGPERLADDVRAAFIEAGLAPPTLGSWEILAPPWACKA